MTNIGKLLLVVFVSLFSFVQVSALDAPSGLKLNESSADTLNISWDAVVDATGYYVYYSTESGVYNKQIDDLLETNNAIIEGLDSTTTYYVSVVSLDSEGGESENSSELEAQTQAQEEVVGDPFSLQSVVVNSFSEIELTFSELLEAHPDASREFKVVNKADNLDELLVVKTQLNEENATKIVLTFDRDALAATEYELTVIDIKSETGKNIESGIDGISSFLTPEAFEQEVTEEEALVVEENVELNSAEPSTDSSIVEEIPEVADLGNSVDDVSGETLTEDDIEKNTVSEASKNDELPETGPAHILIFILTFVAATFFFVFRFRRS